MKAALILFDRPCERNEAIKKPMRFLDCFVASLLAMTEARKPNSEAP
jgi:hypothetical protein